MSPRTIHRAREAHDEATQPHDPQLTQIDELIGLCQERLSSVSDAILSTATKQATLSMYEELRNQAQSDAGVRSERVSWMRENLQSLQQTIIKAARERESFEADLALAVKQGWIHERDVAKWQRTFDDPSLLEMVRSQWVKGEWKTTYMAGWHALAEDRAAALREAAAAGLTDVDLPALAILRENELFLAEKHKFPDRRNLVNETRALIVATKDRTLVLFRQMHSLLKTESSGKDLSLHPAKRGAWLQKIMADPTHYTLERMQEYVKGWRQARAEYDRLAHAYVQAGKPDGCAPMPMNEFLALPYKEGRLVILREWRNRLTTATMTQEDADAQLAQQKRAIRRSVDLHDLETAKRALQLLQKEHPEDTDAQSIAAHIALEESRAAKKEQAQATSTRTSEALTGLHAILRSLPTALTSHVRYLIESGDTDKISTFFYALHVRVERERQGVTTSDDEHGATRIAEHIDHAAIVEERDEQGSLTGNADLYINDRTVPSDTVTLLTQHRVRGGNRSPALVVAGMPIGQQAQVVSMGEHVLHYMYHLRSVGESYRHPAIVRT